MLMHVNSEILLKEISKPSIHDKKIIFQKKFSILHHVSVFFKTMDILLWQLDMYIVTQ